MAHQTSNRRIQAVKNDLKLIILDYLVARKFGLTQRFLRLVHKQFYLKGDVNALQTLNRVQYTHQLRHNALHTHTQQ